MKIVAKIIGINILIVLACDIVVNLIFKNGNDRVADIFGALTVLIIIQALTNLILSIFYFVQGKSEWGLGFILSIGLVLLIGFSACISGPIM